MKKLMTILACAALLLCVGCGAKEAEEPAADKSAVVSDGELVVRLKGNPTTGYTWGWEMQGDCLTEVEQENYLPDETEEDMAGVGGVFEYRFAPAQDGTAHLHFYYERSWEANAPIDSYDFDVTVSGGEISID